MNDSAHQPEDLELDHVEFYVGNLDTAVAGWIDRYGFTVIGTAGGPTDGFRSAALRQGDCTLILTQGTAEDHPATAYVMAHGDGVADIAFRTRDLAGLYDNAAADGTAAINSPTSHDGGGGCVTATVAGFGDLVHTLVQRDPPRPTDLPLGFAPAPDIGSGDQPRLLDIDHFAVCVKAGQLEPTVKRYEAVFGFQVTFEEHIVVGRQAMNSKVVQSRSGDITFTIIEPDVTADPGQIDDFLKNHHGPGIQHIAFSVADAVETVSALSERGVEFLTTPAKYYDLLGRRLTPAGHSLEQLRETSILVDEDHDGQLYQIFTRSSHPRQTLFFEIIERMGAKTFGSANIKALYEAVELEQSRPIIR